MPRTIRQKQIIGTIAILLLLMLLAVILCFQAGRHSRESGNPFRSANPET